MPHDSPLLPSQNEAPFLSALADDLACQLTTLRERYQTHERLLALSSELLCVVGFDGYFQFVNAAWERTLGWTVEELRAQPFVSFIHPDDQAAAATMQQLDREQPGAYCVHRFRCKNGTYIWLEWNITVQPDAQMIYAAVRDLSLQMQDGHERSAADEWLAQSLASSPLVTIEWDTNGIIQRWNPSAERVFGWSAEEALGEHVIKLIAPYVDEGVIPTIIEQHLNGEITNTRFENITKDGRAVTCQWYNVVLHNQAGHPIGVLAQAEDLTAQLHAEQERIHLQEQIIHAQRVALHELSTPLIPLADDVLVMPLIGSLDSARAQQIIEVLLEGVSAQGAATAIIDITGVPIVDTQIANVIIRAAQAVKLLGARVVLTGIRPEVAQTLVGLGINLGGIVTRSTLQSGIAYALGRQK